MRRKVLIVLLLFTTPVFISAQVSKLLGLVNENNIGPYLQPLTTTLGTAMNSGGYYSADIDDLFGFSIGLRGMYLFVPEDDLTFETAETGAESATIYGDRGSYYPGTEGYVTYPAGVNVSSVPAAYPQLTLSIVGTELMIKYMPKITIGKDDFSFWGVGIRHEISRYFKNIPLNIAVQFIYSGMNVSENLKLKNFAINAHASKTIGLFIVYGGIQYESTSTDIEYTTIGDNNLGDPLLKPPSRDVTASVDGKNNFRVTAGGAVKLGVFVFNADFSLSRQNIANAGITFAF